jgi:type IV secretion system protein VirD4
MKEARRAMGSGVKNSLIFGGLLLALVAGVYVSGWLTVTFLSVTSHVNGLTYWSYVRALDLPVVQPYVSKIKLAGYLGFGLTLLAWALSLIPLLKSKAQSLHGDARLADMSDLSKAGLLKQTQQSILIGKYKGRYLWLGGGQHTIVISPTRSGKTTSGWREAQGHTIYVWAPYDDQGRTHRFNPFTSLANSDPAKRIGDIQTIAAILYPDEPGKDPFWTTQSRAAFTAFASFMFEQWEQDARRWDGLTKSSPMHPWPNQSELYPSFERILRLSSGQGSKSTKELLQDILKEPKYHFVSPQTRTVFGNLVGLAEQTFSSVIASMQAPLQQFLNPILAAATNATDFDITTLRKRPSTLYVDIPTNKLDESGKLLNIFFSTVIGNNLTQQLGETPELKYQMLMLMDEFTAMGRVDVWAKRISISASYGVRDLCIVQSRSQLRATYGDNDAQNFITNHGAQIVFAPREQGDANEYSEMMGYKTIRKKNRSRSTGRGVGNRQVSISYSEERRALYLPQEIKELPADDELIFYEGCRPILANKNWFFKDRALKQRASMKPAVIKLANDAQHNKLVTQMSDVIRPQNEQAAKWLAQ